MRSTQANPSYSWTSSDTQKLIQSTSPPPSDTSCGPLLALTRRASRAWMWPVTFASAVRLFSGSCPFTMKFAGSKQTARLPVSNVAR